MLALQPGAVFNEFTIERLLGSGGMGTVYLAGHPRLRRRVALKVLTDTFTLDPKARSAFDREANLAAGLDHPNIVPVYDRNAADDPDLWLAMRYVDGGDAAALLSEHPDGLAPERGARLIDDAARALDYAHDQGVLHRDVKPANLLIETDHRQNERAVLTDFGIARTLDDTVTMSGIAASFAYAAPERFTDSPADRRADIYSLGCTLYQLLTGRPPFPRKDQAAVIGAHLTAPPPAPRALRPELPAEMDAVIATALAKSPQDRYPTCTALAEAAIRCLAPAAVTVRWESARPVPGPALAVPTLARPVAESMPRSLPPNGEPMSAPANIESADVRTTTRPPAEPSAGAIRSPRYRRLALAAGSGVLVTAIGVAGVAYTLRDNTTTPTETRSTSAVSQPVTPTTTQPPPTTSTAETPLDTAESPTEQAQTTAPAVQQHTYTPAAPQVVPHSKSY